MQQKINLSALKTQMPRRRFLRNGIMSLGSGAAAGLGTYAGLDYVGNRLEEILAGADRQIAELKLDVESLYGALDKKLAEETQELKEQYKNGKLKIYAEQGIATPEEVADLEAALERLAKEGEAFSDYYDFAERWQIFKDRIEKRLVNINSKGLATDKTAEKYEAGPLRKANEFFRRTAPGGIKSGEEGEKERERLRGEYGLKRKRLDALCTVYDTNEDNRRAELEVVKKINSYLQSGELPEEEKELYDFLKQEYSREGSKEHLRDFIANYDTYDPRNQVLLKLRASLGEMDGLYSKIVENKDYMTELHGILKEGIELKTRIREQGDRDLAQIQKDVNKLRASVNTMIDTLEGKGYDIQTRQELIEKGVFKGPLMNSLNALWQPIKVATAGGIGLVAGGLAYNFLRRIGKVKAVEKTLGKTAEGYNSVVDIANGLEIENEKLRQENLNMARNSYRGNDYY